MQQEILDYLKTQRVGVLAVEMMDGSPHGATIHFANSGDGSIFFFKTDRLYRKSEALLGKDTTRASFVVGSSEADMRTLQIDGDARIMKDTERKSFEDVYLGKFPEKRKKEPDPNAVYFLLIPTWWRFTDWTKPEGKTILLSTD